MTAPLDPPDMIIRIQRQTANVKVHLEEAMGTFHQEGLSQLADETVNYNPSDIASWLESMFSGFNPIPEFDSSSDPFLESSASVNSQIPIDLDFGSDVVAIPGKAVYPRPQPPPPPEKHQPQPCAEAVQQENFKFAEALVKNIGFRAVSHAGAMRKVATYFAEALARRIYKLYPTNQQDSAFNDMLQMHFYETCPYLKFAHFTANQAILEAFAGKSRVHVIDFTMKQGMQWPALLQALALRPSGPPSFRLTGIGPPSHDETDHLQEVGWRLAQLAESINVEFEYRGFVASSLADLDAAMFEIREGEIVAVNSIFELHQLLARPGAIEKVLQVVSELKLEILTVVEQEANHSGSAFLHRFN
ncbi:DELLA protein GAI1-like [Salvia hispanica]|uniref:DELLA protein GAI1-like n=1 Tax=Salvia hispanica TaxID=49212 RepID=UPI0020095C80|nr:DELLA protein GAI1-like [Salvia hispanica]